MVRAVALLLGLFSFVITIAQDSKYASTFVCTNGKTHFFSSTPVENIDAVTEKSFCIVNTDSRKVTAKIPIRSFKFKKDLMEQHFNENYMETDKFPYAMLDAFITDSIDFTKDGEYDVNLKGAITIHGVKQERTIPGKVTIKNGLLHKATSVFMVKLADHNIKIPKIVFANIAEDIKIDLEYIFERYKKE